MTVIPTVTRQATAGVVLFEDLLIYLAPYRGADRISPRAVARRLGENAAPPRRRTTRASIR